MNLFSYNFREILSRICSTWFNNHCKYAGIMQKSDNARDIKFSSPL